MKNRNCKILLGLALIGCISMIVAWSGLWPGKSFWQVTTLLFLAPVFAKAVWRGAALCAEAETIATKQEGCVE